MDNPKLSPLRRLLEGAARDSEKLVQSKYAYHGPSSDLQASPQVIRKWIDYWFEHAEGFVEIAWRSRDMKKVSHAEHFDIRDPRLEQFACQVNSVPGQDTYFTPSIVVTHQVAPLIRTLFARLASGSIRMS